MKTLLVAISALLLTACESSRTHSNLTAEQAAALCVQLANDKAEAAYHRRPFENKLPANFQDGRWLWSGIEGIGLLDYHAKVELAADGSTNRVEIRLTDDALHPRTIVPNGGLPPAQLPPDIKH